MNKKQTVITEINEMRRHLKMQPLTEAEILDNELSQIDLNPLNEGWWENAKYALSKLGRYKAGGKILGKSQTTSKANAEIAQLLAKKGNEAIRILDDRIKKTNPEFPNNKSQDDFLNTILDICFVYDSTVAAAKKKIDEPGSLPVDAANELIGDLVTYVKKYLDVDLTAAFSVFTEGVEEVEDIRPIDPAGKKADLTQKFADTKQSIKKGDTEAYGSERMKTLKSWKLPLALTGVAASFGAMSWLVEYIFPPDKITQWTPQIIQEKAQAVLGNIKPGEGMTQIMNRVLGTHLNPNSNPKEIVDALSKLGGGDANKGIEIITQKGGIFSNPEAAKNTLSAIVGNPTEHGGTLKQVFSGTWAGTGRMAGDTLVTLPGKTLMGMVVKSIVQWKAKSTLVKSAKAAVAAPVLKALGIALLAGGAVVAMSRYKGRKSSRAQMLNDLMQHLRPVPQTKENPSILPVKLLPGAKAIAGELPAAQQQAQIGPGQAAAGQLPAGKQQGQIGTTTPKGLLGAGGKLTQPGDIDDIVRLMESLDLNKLLEGSASDVTNEDIVTLINEAVGTPRKYSHAQLFKQLADLAPEYAGKIKSAYISKYNRPINLLKLEEFLKTIFSSMGRLKTDNILTLLNRADISPKSFKQMISSIQTQDNQPNVGDIEQGLTGFEKEYDENDLPNNIGGYDLTKVKQAARIAMVEKASEILKRNNMEASKENMDKVLLELIQDINAGGQKMIPKVGAERTATAPSQFSKPTQSQQGVDQTSVTNTGVNPYEEPVDTDQGLRNPTTPYYKEPKRR